MKHKENNKWIKPFETREIYFHRLIVISFFQILLGSPIVVFCRDEVDLPIYFLGCLGHRLALFLFYLFFSSSEAIKGYRKAIKTKLWFFYSYRQLLQSNFLRTIWLLPLAIGVMLIRQRITWRKEIQMGHMRPFASYFSDSLWCLIEAYHSAALPAPE